MHFFKVNKIIIQNRLWDCSTTGAGQSFLIKGQMVSISGSAAVWSLLQVPRSAIALWEQPKTEHKSLGSVPYSAKDLRKATRSSEPPRGSRAIPEIEVDTSQYCCVTSPSCYASLPMTQRHNSSSKAWVIPSSRTQRIQKVLGEEGVIGTAIPGALEQTPWFHRYQTLVGPTRTSDASFLPSLKVKGP